MGKNKDETPRPSATQLAAAQAILKQFTQATRGSASDTLLLNAVYSIHAALGGPGQPSAEYSDTVTQATGGEIAVSPMLRKTESGFTVTSENPMGLSIGKSYAEIVGTEDEPTEEQADTVTKEDDATNQNPLGLDLSRLNKVQLLAEAAKRGITDATSENTKAEIIAMMQPKEATEQSAT